MRPKTWSLQSFGEKYFSKCHYVNFEKNKSIAKFFDMDLEPKQLLDKIAVALDVDINPCSDLLILDEIQAVPQALTSLKYFCEDMRELAICAAGSLLGLKLSPVSFPVGKVDYLYMYPLSFFEFLEALGKTRLLKIINTAPNEIQGALHEQLWELLRSYFVIGGLPEVVSDFVKNSKLSLNKNFQLARLKQKQIISTYLDDMTKHCGKENAMHIERIWRDIPNQLAKEQNGSASRFQFKGIIPGVQAYSRLVGAIDWLEATGLIIKTKIVHHAGLPLSAFSKENRFKLYLFDVGLLGALSSLKVSDIWDQDYGNYKGYYAENFVAQELRSKGLYPEELYAWSEGRAEIEFLRDTEQGIIPIEVKSGSNTQAKSLQAYIDRYKPDHSILLTAKDPQHYQNTNNVLCKPLYLAALY